MGQPKALLSRPIQMWTCLIPDAACVMLTINVRGTALQQTGRRVDE